MASRCLCRIRRLQAFGAAASYAIVSLLKIQHMHRSRKKCIVFCGLVGMQSILRCTWMSSRRSSLPILSAQVLLLGGCLSFKDMADALNVFRTTEECLLGLLKPEASFLASFGRRWITPIALFKGCATTSLFGKNQTRDNRIKVTLRFCYLEKTTAQIVVALPSFYICPLSSQFQSGRFV